MSPTPAQDVTHEARPRLIQGYQPVPNAFSEMLDAKGGLRPHWRALIRGFSAMGPETITQRWAGAQRFILDNGVTYNAHDQKNGSRRPWALDPIPLVLDAPEWAALSKALIQRATLLNLILKDLYGPQRLIREAGLPADLLLANPQFLRPVWGIEPAGGRHLTLIAFDIARNPAGQWWVVNDRTQAPSGAGYALENRLILSRTFPDLYRDAHVQRLAHFFSALRDALGALAPQHREDPRIVVLTPGPFTETYFEHAYLARYLGFTLVEGGDLTVRDGRVYLKTLAGLKQVDVILRRLDDGYCDPLELRADSALGVAGLVQAVASGQVAIANALGSGVTETPAIMSFLPALCRRLLGEELRLPSVATWWCGQPKELAYVREHLHELVIKPAFPGDGRMVRPVFGSALLKPELEMLWRSIEALPHRFVAQESVSLSTAPAWQDGSLTPRHLMLRAYVAATPEGYVVMPGGLTRASPAQDSMIVTMREGGGSKDTWVRSDEPTGRFSLLTADGRAVGVSRSGADLPSRVADSLYWLGRYVERAENHTHLLRAILVRMTEETAPVGSPELATLIAALGELTDHLPPEGPIEQPLVEAQRTAAYLSMAVYDTARVGSLRGDLDRTRQLASIVRDRISPDTWRVIDQMERGLPAVAPPDEDMAMLLSTLDRLVIPLAAFAGMSNESMTHGYGWRFLDMGRRIERASWLTMLMQRVVADTQQQAGLLDALLHIASSVMTYRSRYRAGVALGPVVDLLLLDETNPRSVAFQLARIEAHVAALPHDTPQGQLAEDQRLVLLVRTLLQLADVDALAQADESGSHAALRAMLADLAAQLPRLSDLLTHRYLAHTALPTPMTAQPATLVGESEAI